MILDRRFCVAVVAVHRSFGISKLSRHWLAFDGVLQLPELHFHIDDTSAANGTAVRSFHVLVVASMVDTMATSHEDDSLR